MASPSQPLIDPVIHDAVAMRAAGPELLQLALLEARSRTLAWAEAFEGLRWGRPAGEHDPPWWLVGQAGWAQALRPDVLGTPTADDLPRLDGSGRQWFDPLATSREQRWAMEPPPASMLQDFLAQTLDSLLDALGRCGHDDAELEPFRAALDREDRLGERLAVMAQALDLDAARLAHLQQGGWLPQGLAHGPAAPIPLPGRRMSLGSDPGGWVPPLERWAHEVAVADFEIDAHVVRWVQFVEFIQDGGYDDRRLWTDAGWEWLETTTRRAPRHVEQVAGGVFQRRFGRLNRVHLAEATVHASVHEAEAWCRWAGRRLPTEAEWEAAALTARSLGHRWGEVLEWVAGSARPYPGAPLAPPAAGLKVLRGGSPWASRRLLHPKARRFVPGSADILPTGFRTAV